MQHNEAPDAGQRILGADPGLVSTGWGIVETRHRRYRLLAQGAISTSAREDFPQRLKAIFQEFSGVIETHRPHLLAIEKIIYARNIKVALSLGQVRGLLVLAATMRGLSVFEYTPKEIKMAITGNGNAAKLQVQKMVQHLLGLSEMPSPHDIADALAVALCHEHRTGRIAWQETQR